MRFEVTILGSNSAIPAHGRHPSAQVLNIRDHHFLIDCGEGTQMRMDTFKIKKTRIEHIFISHLHGDHVFGLIGLMMTYGLHRRTAPLHIYAPKGIEELVRHQLQTTYSETSYPIHFHITDTEKSELVFENNEVAVYTLPLRHGVPCNGYLFKEKRAPRKILPQALEQWQVPNDWIARIKYGADYITPQGNTVPNHELTCAPPAPRSFAYCSDTMYHEPLIPLLEGVDTLYHEATYLHNALDNAIRNHHSTALQAAQIAQKAGAKLLLIGHFSSRYGDLDPLLAEARTVFANTHLAVEGKVFFV